MSTARLPVLLTVLLLAGCATLMPAGTTKHAEEATQADDIPVSFAQVPGWQNENFDDALGALRKSCAVMMKRDAATPVAPTAIAGTIADWQPACRALNDATTPISARNFFENYFTPYHVTTPNGDNGLFTGYYEKVLHGSRTKTAKYHVPIYKRPADLVMVELGDFKPEWQGQRIAGSVHDGKLKPYADRRAIDEGALSGKGLEIAWSDDENAVFFLHVQGSGRLILEDGSEIRLAYDGQNGQAYKAIGRELIARGELTKENVSLDTIRAWLVAHPQEAAALRWTNPSYVFFKEVPGTTDGPNGAQGVALTPLRSLAVDPRFIPYGAPIFLDIEQPLHKETRLQRLVIAQDTGGAITGPVRGDLFWGTGDFGSPAATGAGNMKSRGSAYLLLPKTLSGARHITLRGK